MFAIVDILGKQYKVMPNEIVEVNKISGKVGDIVTFVKVLLVVSDTETQIGAPHVKNAKVEAKILVQGKGVKIEVRRYKSKVRYRHKRGFRPYITRLQVNKISF